MRKLTHICLAPSCLPNTVLLAYLAVGGLVGTLVAFVALRS